MPLIILGIGSLVGAGIGFWAGDGTKSINNTVQWIAIGGCVFLAAKYFKYI